MESKEIIKDKYYLIIYIFTDENIEFLNDYEAVRIIIKIEEYNKIKHYLILIITAFNNT